MPQKILLLILGGSAGTLARYAVSQLALRWWGDGFPWGTFAVNALGCLLFGLVAGLAEERLAITPAMRLLILTGFMGAFTTFSTFAFESGAMMRDAQWAWAAANIVGQNVVGLALLLVGLRVGQLV